MGELSTEMNPIFIHIPRTGGTTIKGSIKVPDDVFKGGSPGHGHPRWIERTSPDQDPEDHFAVIRNPFSWHVSWYHYLKQNTDTSGLHALENVIGSMNFVEYLRYIDSDAPVSFQKPEEDLWPYPKWQIKDWLCDETGALAVKNIWRFERHFGMGLHLNKTIHKGWRVYYDRESADIVRRRHKDDFKLFEYSTDI